MADWYVYLIRTRQGTLYTGITTDVRRRLDEHEAGNGSRYLRGRGPLELLYQLPVDNRSLAQRIEAAIKRLSREGKNAIIATRPGKRALLKILEPESGSIEELNT